MIASPKGLGKLYCLLADVDKSASGAITPTCAKAQARAATYTRSLTNKLVDSLRLVMSDEMLRIV